MLRDKELNALAKGGFDQLSLRIEKRQESMTVKTTLNSIHVTDFFTSDSHFPEIVEPAYKDKGSEVFSFNQANYLLCKLTNISCVTPL